MNGKSLKYFVMGAAMVAAGLGAFAITLPAAFTSGEALSAAKFNDYFTRIKNAIDALEAPASVNTAKLADGAVTPEKLAAAALPRLTSFALSAAVITTNTTPTQLSSFSVNPPGPGQLFITVTGELLFEVAATGTTSVISSYRIGLCDTASSSAACDGTYLTRFVQDPDNASALGATQNITISRVVPVTAAGTRTFFVNAQTDNSAHPIGFNQAAKAVVIFFPAAPTLASASAR